MGKLSVKEGYLLLLIVSAFISISIFEVLVVVGVVWALVDAVRYRKLEGRLKVPVLLFSSVSLLSTVIYAPKMIFKAVEEGLFQLLYFFRIDAGKRLVRRITTLFIGIGAVLLPAVFYHYITTGKTKMLWGGAFEVGQFYGLFALLSFLYALFHFRKGDRYRFLVYLILFFVFTSVLVISVKRSPILGFVVVLYLVFFILYRNGIFGRFFFYGLNVFLLTAVALGYIYLSHKDPVRYGILTQIVKGEKKLDFKTLDRLSSSRMAIGKDALRIIQKDIQEGNWINLLIGHGVRSGYYLPHKFDKKKRPKYESIFILSEFVEKGFLGLTAVLLVFFYAFKTFLTVRLREDFDLIGLGLFIPLMLHLVGTVFTFFWDAMLPMYLLLFRVGEVYFGKRG